MREKEEQCTFGKTGIESIMEVWNRKERKRERKKIVLPKNKHVVLVVESERDVQRMNERVDCHHRAWCKRLSQVDSLKTAERRRE